ncbi:hypothetical protein DPMN_102300 [Dreissena polymorpha]|uniref:Uncharacterized protein n=1 Tax=Dreissena polymorpha TaxID=45954 RepID=A0A9D4R9S1_DREPO|nr:hypothetical protein DPMN_102300 [Dreissena polymorpha]
MCAGNGFATITHRNVIFILVLCCPNDGELLTCIVDRKPMQYDQDKLCCNGLHTRVENGLEKRCCNGTVYADLTHKCDNGIIVNIEEEIKNDTLQTSDVSPQTKNGPPKCPLCITGNHSGPAECKKKNKLNVRLEEIAQRKRDRLWLHVTVTRPEKYAGWRMILKTKSVCRECFQKGVAYVIFTNRWLDSLPEKSRITGSDVIVRKDQLSSFNCTVIRWAKTS